MTTKGVRIPKLVAIKQLIVCTRINLATVNMETTEIKL